MTETRGGFGEHARHNEQRAGHAGGNAEGQSRRPHEYAGSAREQHNKRVLEDIRSQLQEETTTYHIDGSRTTRIRYPQIPGRDPEIAAEIDAIRAADSLPWLERRRAWAEIKARRQRRWTKKTITGGLSVEEYLARNPNVDPDLFTDDGRYLPLVPWGLDRYALKKLVKFLHRLFNPEKKEKKAEKPHLVIVQPPPEEPEEPPPPEQPDAPKEQATAEEQPQK
jgi:hypothetical protein